MVDRVLAVVGRHVRRHPRRRHLPRPSQEFTLDTPAGEATLVALPNSLTKPFLLNPLQALLPLGNGFFTFEPTCVSDSMAVASCRGRWLPDALSGRRGADDARKPTFNGKLHTKHGVIS